MGIIDFDEAKKRSFINQTEYYGSVIITICKDNEKGKYTFNFEMQDMDYEEMEMLLMDISLDIRENEGKTVFETTEAEIIDRPIKITLFLPKDERRDDFVYMYEYVKEPETEVTLNVLVAIIANAIRNL